MRIRNQVGQKDTTYTYNTNCRLSQMLMKTTNGVVTKYVYGLGLIGEETNGTFKTYHCDYRGSTTAITDASGAVTDTFRYDTYGKLLSRTGTSDVIFGYNGRDGAVTDENSFIYMRARYYSPELRRFVNADVLKGDISNAVTLNRYAYANGNPVSNVDPFGLAPEIGEEEHQKYINYYMANTENPLYKLLQTWGISLTEEVYNAESEIINAFWGGVKVKLLVEVIYETSPDALNNFDFSDALENLTFEVNTPEVTLPWSDIGTQTGVYIDVERTSVGHKVSNRVGEWTYEYKYQTGLYSEANVVSLIYTPGNELLPTVSVSVDTEIHHAFKAAVAAVALACIYAPEAIKVAAPTLTEFLKQLSNMKPEFAMQHF